MFPAAVSKAALRSPPSLTSAKPEAKQTAPPAFMVDKSATIWIVASRLMPINAASGAEGSAARLGNTARPSIWPPLGCTSQISPSKAALVSWSRTDLHHAPPPMMATDDGRSSRDRSRDIDVMRQADGEGRG